MSVKKIPMRMCTGCREMKPKNSLFRIVKTPSGEIVLDKTGKANGRGAYICKDTECLKRAQRSGVLARTFEVSIDDGLYSKIESELSGEE